MKRKNRQSRTNQLQRRRRQLRSELLEPRLPLAVDTWEIDLSATGTVNLFDPNAGGDVQQMYEDNDLSEGGVISTSNVPGQNNRAPIAIDDAVATDQDTVLNGDVLIANPTTPDSDPDGDPITVTQVEGAAGNVGIVVTLGSGATVNVAAAGTFAYDPNGAFDSLGAGVMTTDTFTYTIEDPLLATDTGTVTVTITGLNDVPTATNLTQTQGYLEDAEGVDLDDIVVTDPDVGDTITATLTLTNTATGTITATSGNGETYTPGTGVWTISGSVTAVNAALASAAFLPATDNMLTSTITTHVEDGAATGPADGAITLNVTAVNDAPSFTKGADETVLEDAGAQTVGGWATAISAGPPDESGQTLSFNITSNSNPGLFSVAPAVDSSGQLTYTPAADANGSAVITLNIMDNGGTANGGDDTSPDQTFTINVTAVNDEPSFTKGADETVLEDAGAQTVAAWASSLVAGPANEAAQTFSFNITGNSNPGLFSAAPAVDGTGELTYTPAADANGSSVITLNVMDSGGTANGGDDTSPDQTFTINVTAVNDEPSFTKGADETVLEDAGAQTVSGWATALVAGPADEAAQTFSFNITSNSNPGLFSAAPAVDGAGELTYTPAADANGSAVITLNVMDNGGTANGGDDTSSDQTFTINVTAVNDEPSFTKGADETVLEDAGTQTVSGWATSLVAGPADEAAQTFSFNITSNSNPGLFSAAPAVDGTGELTYTPAANANGSAVITLNVMDNGGTANSGDDTSDDQTFTINVTAVNDEPSFTKGADETVLEDAGAAETVSGWATSLVAGPADEAAQTFSFNITSNSNPGLFSAAPAVDGAGELTYTPAADANGSAVITLNVMDNGGTANGGDDTSDDQTFTINVTAVNDEPSFTKGADETVLEDAVAQTVAGWATSLVAGPADEAAQTFSFNITSNSNPGLFSAAPAVDGTGELTYTAAADANGSAVITLNVMDNGGTANSGDDTSDDQTFTINVTAVNDEPSFTKGADETVLEDAGAQTVSGWATSLVAGPADEAAQTFSFNITSNSNPGLFSAAPAVDGAGELTYTPAANANGSAVITLNVMDNGGTANGGDDTSDDQTFTINVTAVNDEPSFTKGADETVLEDAGAQTVSGWATSLVAGPADEAAQTFSFNITGNSNPGLFSAAPAVDGTGELTYTPAANANGSAVITLNVMDNGGTANSGDDTSDDQTFTINVTAVNDEPSFTKGADETVLEDAGAQTVSGWATSLVAGPADEAAQTFSFNITSNSNPGLFSAAPAVDGTGELTYTPAANANGSAVITLNVMDNGGTANSGDDTSPDQTFTINVTAVNDAPVLNLDDDNSGTNEPNFAATFNTGVGTPINITDTDVTLTDVDSTTLASATVTITNIQDAGVELLTATPSGSILAGDISYAAGTGILTISKVASLADYDAVLSSVTYDNNAGSATLTPARVVNFVVNDGTDSSTVVTSTVTLIAGPLLDLDDDDSTDTGNDASVSFTEDAGAVNVTDNDPDIVSPVNIASVTFILTNRPDGVVESLSVNGALPGTLTVTDTYDNADGKLVISGSEPAATYVTALQQIQYNNTSQNPGTADRIVTVVVRDGNTIDSDAATSTISVTAVNDAPIDADEAYAAQSNVGLDVNAANGLLMGATDPEGNTPVTLAAGSIGTFATTAGGSITTLSDGSFTYTPEAGDVTVADTFLYTATDSLGATSTSTATFNVNAETIWFVDTTAGVNGDGTLASPFNTLTDLDTGGGSDTLDLAGHAIYVFTSDATQPSLTLANDFLLETGQKLIGEGATGADVNTLASFTTQTHSATIPALSGSNAVLSTGGSDAITLGSGNTIRGIDIGNTGAGHAIFGNTFGTLTIDDVNISGTGPILDLTTGTISDPIGGDATFTNLISTSNTGDGIRMDAVGGSFTVDSNTTISGGTLGINIGNAPASAAYDFGTTSVTGSSAEGIAILTSNSAATFTFDSLAVTSAGTGLRASSAGTINVAGTGNTISSTAGSGVDIISTTIGNGGGGAMTFSSLSSTNSSGDGINLDTVTGTFTANGGTITNTGGIGIDIASHTGGFTFAGTLDNNGGRSVEVTDSGGSPANTILFSGAIDDEGTGIFLDNNDQNAGATITFSGGITSDTGANTAFTATNGGTVNTTGTNRIGATSALSTTAINVANTTIGSSNLNFEEVNVTGATTGIVLNNTGSSGGLKIGAGGTSPDDGGVFSTLTNAMLLTLTSDVSLNRVRFQDISLDGVLGDRITDGTDGDSDSFQVTNSVFRDIGTTAGADDVFDFFSTNTTNGTFNISGNVTFTGNTFDEDAGGADNAWEGTAIHIQNQSAVTMNLLVDNTTFANTSTAANDAIGVLAGNGATHGIDVQDSVATNIRGALLFATTEELGSSANVDFFRNEVRRTTGHTIGAGVLLNATQQSSLTFDIQDNCPSSQTGCTSGDATAGFYNLFNDPIDIAINGSAGQTTVTSNEGRINKNRIENATGDSIGLFTDGDGAPAASTVLIDNNVVLNTVAFSGQAVDIDFRETPNSPNAVPAAQRALNLTITNNIFGTVASPLQDDGIDGLDLNNDSVAVPDPNGVFLILIEGNSIVTDAGSAVRLDIEETGTADITIRNNPLLRSNSTTGGENAVEVKADAATTMDVSIFGNTSIVAGAGNSDIELDRDDVGTTMNVTQSLADLTNLNDGGAATVLISDETPTYSTGTPTIPTLPANALVASGGEVLGGNSPNISEAQIAGVVGEAIARWSASGLTADQHARLNQATFEIADLPGALLGSTSSTMVTLDANAAGHGWYVDATPDNDSEFDDRVVGPRPQGDAWYAAAQRMDLLTVVMHELGHVLGYDHDDDEGALLAEALSVGTRRLPAVEAHNDFFAALVDEDE